MPSLQGATLASLRNDVASLSSSSDVLGRMLLAGPQSIGGGSAAQQFQQAIDGYSIGQRYLTQNNNPSMALPWLTRSAEQPQGYGLLSQLSLADLYRSGGTGRSGRPAALAAILPASGEFADATEPNVQPAIAATAANLTRLTASDPAAAESGDYAVERRFKTVIT